MKLLHVDSSILGDNSVSRTISAAIVETLKRETPGLTIVHRDLGTKPIPHLSGAYLAGQSADVKHDQALQEDLDLGGQALAEFLDADIVVIGVPMYNFAVPSQLKAWIDRILVAGKTFRYTASGAEGLVHGKRVVLAVSRGGIYVGTPAAALEHQESWLKAVFAFMGLTDVEVIRAEGIAYGLEAREKSLKAALEAATHVAASRLNHCLAARDRALRGGRPRPRCANCSAGSRADDENPALSRRNGAQGLEACPTNRATSADRGPAWPPSASP